MSDTQSQHDAQFAEQWMTAQRPLSAYVTAAVPAFHDSEDIMQRVAVVAFTKRDQFDPARSTFLSWVTGIARFEIQNWRRKQSTTHLCFDEATLNRLAEAHESVVADEVPEIHAALRECMAKLNDRSRAMLDMRYRDAMRSDAIAEEFKTSPAVVDVTLSRARASLAKCVGRTVGWKEASK